MQAEANIVERLTRMYVTYRGMRVVCVLAALICIPLLFVLAGGFPPYAWRLLFQAVANLPALLAAHGSGVLLALLGVLLLSLTILIAWGGLLWLSWRMFAYWRYERQELRNFAADLEEAQYQAEELEGEQYAEAEDFTREQDIPMQAGRAVRRSSPPATRRRVIYPLTPLPPQMQDEDFYGQNEEDNGDGAENFFLDEEEEENTMGLYRDEDDDEDEMEWEQQHAANASAPARPASPAGVPVYDRQIVEHASPFPASAALPGGQPDNLQHSSYGRILPFSAAPSAGALPHLTSTLYNRVPMPRSVAPQPAREPITPEPRPAASAGPQPTAAPRARPEQPPAFGPTRPAVAPPSVAAPSAPHMPVESAKQQIVAPPSLLPAPSPRPQSEPQARKIVPTQPAVSDLSSQPRAIPARPTAKLVAPVQPPQPRAIPVRAPEQQAAPSHAQPAKQQGSAMQSLVELISTVPLTPPPTKAPIHMPQPLVRAEAAQRQSTLQLVVSTGLDVGLKRRGKPNEDSLLALQNTRVLRGNSCPVGLFVVADGMGGHENGQEASHLVIQSLSKTVVPSIIYGPTDDNYSELLAEGVHHANLEVYQRNRQAKVDMGTTIVAALVVDTTAYVVSAGDSRVYLYRATSGLTQVTRDHSTVARLVESGLLKPEDVYTHPRRNEIYRSLGHHPSEDLDKFILALQPEDVLLLCSDGLWEMVRDEHIQEIIASTANQPTQTSAALVQAALDGGGKDNISVIVVYVKAALGAQAAWAG